ncbi:PREDICTED: uncharacterized protein LOC106744610 [Dinoponera quadriceps]|uniref:Odorant receptor n=1 Tax=Dinoponera quadriceps TaxID=609295 RepID=A0A6P3X9T5_DINQU|nr:PREDICTED: uncharacterized protein LOC106744610 [Dinoponera quadriceps]
MGDPINGRNSFIVTTYLANKEHDIRLIRWLLKSICLWPRSGKASIVDRVLSEFLIFTCFSLLFMTIVSMGLVIFVEKREDMDVMMINMGPFVYLLMTVMKYTCLIVHVDDIRKCIDCIELDWDIVKTVEDYEVMLKDAKIGRFVATCITLFVYCTIQSYNITRCFMKTVVNVDNVSVLTRGLPYPFYNEIVDTRFSPAYEIVLVIHFVSGFLLCNITNVNCGLMAILVMHACGQLKILIQWLGDIVQEDDVIDISTVQQKLGFIVEHHLQVIKFVSHTENIMYLTCLVELLGGSILLCFAGYCCLTAWHKAETENIPVYSVIVVSVILNIFIICYIAEVLSEQVLKASMTYLNMLRQIAV